jgi:hypothetical protein
MKHYADNQRVVSPRQQPQSAGKNRKLTEVKFYQTNVSHRDRNWLKDHCCETCLAVLVIIGIVVGAVVGTLRARHG